MGNDDTRDQQENNFNFAKDSPINCFQHYQRFSCSVQILGTYMWYCFVFLVHTMLLTYCQTHEIYRINAERNNLSLLVCFNNLKYLSNQCSCLL